MADPTEQQKIDPTWVKHFWPRPIINMKHLTDPKFVLDPNVKCQGITVKVLKLYWTKIKVPFSAFTIVMGLGQIIFCCSGWARLDETPLGLENFP